MQIETPLHAEHQLDQVAGQFAHWRQTRTQPRERISETLWDQAVALTPALVALPRGQALRVVCHRSQQTDCHTPRLNRSADSRLAGLRRTATALLVAPGPPWS